MGAFASLSERLNHIFSKLTKRGRLTELEIKTAMREVRVALLEADVNVKVAKQPLISAEYSLWSAANRAAHFPASVVINDTSRQILLILSQKRSFSSYSSSCFLQFFMQSETA